LKNRVRKAAIDIGTNSTRLLIADQDQEGRLYPVRAEERITRLGQGVGQKGVLTKQGVDRVLAAIEEYSALARQLEVTEFRLFATSAARDAPNRRRFARRIRDATGLEVAILSGEEEARLACLGAISDLPRGRGYTICDIGGGSTEFIFAGDEGVIWQKSLDIGSRRLNAETDPSELASRLRRELQIGLEGSPAGSEPFDCILVGGTATTLALMDARIGIEHASEIHHHTLTRARLNRVIERLRGATVDQRKGFIGLHPDRADVILTGSVIVRAVFDYLAKDSAMVSLRDGLYGILLEGVERHDV